MPYRHQDPFDETSTSGSEPSTLESIQKPGVLVVDDDPMVRNVVRLGLQNSGFIVWLAANGKEAASIYDSRQSQIDVVLLDVKMKGLDGPATLDALRELNPDVRACFMSGDFGNYEPDELIQRGAASVIKKPFRLDQLARILRLVASGVPFELLPIGE